MNWRPHFLGYRFSSARVTRMLQEQVSTLLAEMRAGDPGAMDRLMPLVYDELYRMARQKRWQQPGGNDLGTTSLVHEAYLKMTRGATVDWQSRAHFFYMASMAMRNVLTDNARRRSRRKRGSGVPDLPLGASSLVSHERTEELLALDEALTQLESRKASLARIVECRFYGGLTVEETSAALGISEATVKRGWATARAMLYRQLKETSAVEPA